MLAIIFPWGKKLYINWGAAFLPPTIVGIKLDTQQFIFLSAEHVLGLAEARSAHTAMRNKKTETKLNINRR